MLITSGATYLLSLMSSSTQVGYFGAAERFVALGLGLLGPAGQVLMPTIANLHGSKSNRAYELARKGMTLEITYGLLVLFGGVLLSPFILPIVMGPQFGPSIPILQVLSCIFPFVCFNHALGMYAFIPLRKEKFLIIATVVGLIVNVIIALMTVKSFGAIGMAYARLGGEMASFATLLYDRRETGRFEKDTFEIGSLSMRAFVVIATKGRAQEMRRLLDYLHKQTLQLDHIVVAGTQPSDIEGLSDHPLISRCGTVLISPKIGLTSQRNFGIETLEKKGLLTNGRFFCAFFDDDYRPADDWLEQANRRFDQGDIVGLTGRILADGVRRGGMTEDEAILFLNGTKAPEQHWADGTTEGNTNVVYGCNMAFADTVIKQIRFDETLPFYGWQEDRDYTGMACRIGKVIFYPNCRGVHLGVTSGRVSGVRFGYSQIANPIYLMKKGTMGVRVSMRFMLRALAANSVRSFGEHPIVDYRGRLRGNMRALRDLLYGRLDPRRIAESNF